MDETEVDTTQAQAQQAHWRQNLTLTSVLLAVWFLVTFVHGFFARDLNFDFFGWPFSFWMTAQGAPLVYVLIVACYAWRMEQLDREYGVAEDDES